MSEVDTDIETVYPDSVLRSIYNIVGINADLILITLVGTYAVDLQSMDQFPGRALFAASIAILLTLGMWWRMGDYYGGQNDV